MSAVAVTLQTVAFALYGWMTKLFLSCAYPTFRAPGHKITTLEGLQEEAELLAACIASEGADQCGFCTTGMMMSAINLKRKIQRLAMMRFANTS